MKYTKKELLIFIRHKTSTNPKWAVRSLTLIYSKQDSAEKTNKSTFYSNNEGFNRFDAPILTKLYIKLKSKGLDKSDLTLLYKIIPKYSAQVLKFGNKEKILLGYEQYLKSKPGKQTNLEL